jgi:hypothetical protein
MKRSITQLFLLATAALVTSCSSSSPHNAQIRMQKFHAARYSFVKDKADQHSINVHLAQSIRK